jgi:ribosome recycling factor
MIADQFQQALDDARDHMHKSLEHLAAEFSHIQAGRASAAMLDGVRVDAYGSPMPLNQVASVSAPQHDLILVQPWDRSTLKAIEKGITEANLGLNPTNDGTLIRLSIPPLTEERRRDLAKTAKTKTEDAKVAIRNVRRDAKDHIKRAYEDDKLPEDMRFEAEERLQKLTDEHVARADAMLEKKEHEIMAV